MRYPWSRFRRGRKTPIAKLVQLLVASVQLLEILERGGRWHTSCGLSVEMFCGRGNSFAESNSAQLYMYCNSTQLVEGPTT